MAGLTARPRQFFIGAPVSPQAFRSREARRRLRRRLRVATLLGLMIGAPARNGAAQPAPASAGLSFSEALTQLRAANQSIKASDLLVRQRGEEQHAAKSLFWPKLTLGASALQLSSPIEQRISLDPLRTILPIPLPLPPITFVLQEERFAETSVNARWILYTGGRAQAANAAAEARVEEATALGRSTTASLETSLVRLYFGAQLQARVKEVRQEALRVLDEITFNAKRLEEEGLIARTERLAAEVARADGGRQLSAAESDLELARIALASVLVVDEVGPLNTPPFVNQELEPVEWFVAAMRQNHPALVQVRVQQTLAAEAAKAERGAYKPDVFLLARQVVAEADLSHLVPRGVYGVGATWTLFDGPARRRRAAAAALQIQRAAELGGRAERDLATLVQQKYREFVKARDQYQSLATSLDLVQENLRARTQAFAEGLATTLEVVDAQLQRSRVQTERLAAAYACVVALAELLESSGQSERFEAYRGKGTEVGER